MMSDPFLMGDSVIAIVDYGGVSTGAIGKVVSRWRGTVYVVKLPDGTFGWLDSGELVPADPSRAFIDIGETGVVASDRHRHGFARVGDKLPVVKVVHDMDYYGVLFGNVMKWVPGIQLAKHM